jgi:hypothetical protein
VGVFVSDILESSCVDWFVGGSKKAENEEQPSPRIDTCNGSLGLSYNAPYGRFTRQGWLIVSNTVLIGLTNAVGECEIVKLDRLVGLFSSQTSR